MNESASPQTNNPHEQRTFGLVDLIAGLSIAGLLLPEAVAYSGIAGLPPQAGVIGLLIGLLCYGLIGTSRFAIVSATSSSAAVLYSAVYSMADIDPAHRLLLASGLIILTGGFFVLASIAKLGEISNFIAKPVLRGFAVGLAITIVIKQFPNIIDVKPTHSDIFRYINDLALGLPHWNLTGLVIAVVALVLLKIFAHWRTIPGALLVIAGGIALDVSGFTAAHGVAAVGTINLTLEWPTLPTLSRLEWLRLGELAIALLMILYAESYGAIRTFAIKHGDSSAPNRDLMALGISNILSGFFHGMPVGAGYSATSANESAGAQSRWSGWIAALVVLALVLTLLPWIEHTPEPILAAIVIHAVSHSITWDTFRPYFMWKRDRIIIVSAVLAVLVLGVLDGLLAAIGVSLIMMLRTMSDVRVAWLGELGDSHDYVDILRHSNAITVPDVLIARPESALFFANAEKIFGLILAKIDATPSTKIMIISFEESPDLDSTSLEALRDFADNMQRRNIALLFARVKDPLRDIFRTVNLPEIPTTCYDARSVDDAMTEAKALLAKNA
ncbi:MAG: SulP family inorganic anion transporter [Gammaproteobacteria bacterium]|nr:SulP family inorganic anion transporter [Gammaproteobacteria bacterium]